jgi:quercetin dioxygenase-like cupin family protein
MPRVFDQLTTFCWETLPTETLSDWVSRRGVHGRHLTLAQFIMRKGYIVDRHSHPNEQITLVLRGALRLDFETGESYVLRDGEFILVPPNLVHWGSVLEETLDFDAFSPPRWDWLEASEETYYTTGNRGGRSLAIVPEPSPRSAPGRSILRVYKWDDLPAEEVAPGIERRALRGRHEVFHRLVFSPGTVYEGAAGAERALWVTEGSVRCHVEGGTPMTLHAGECLLVPESVSVRVEAHEPTTCLEAVAGSATCPAC